MKRLALIAIFLLYTSTLFGNVLDDDPMIMWHGSRKSSEIALTFDDGPYPEATREILKILKEHKIPATFYVVGRSAQVEKEVLMEIVREGHELGNHSFSHIRLDTMSDAEIKLELSATNELIHELTHKKMRTFRPPGGRFNKIVVENAKKLDMIVAMWDVNPGDYALPIKKEPDFPYAPRYYQKPAKVIARRVINITKNGSILLFHNAAGETTKALPTIITELQKKGFKFVTVSELYRHQEIKKP